TMLEGKWWQKRASDAGESVRCALVNGPAVGREPCGSPLFHRCAGWSLLTAPGELPSPLERDRDGGLHSQPDSGHLRPRCAGVGPVEECSGAFGAGHTLRVWG